MYYLFLRYKVSYYLLFCYIKPISPSNGYQTQNPYQHFWLWVSWWCNKIVCLTKSSEINSTLLSFFLLTSYKLKLRQSCKVEREKKRKMEKLVNSFSVLELDADDSTIQQPPSLPSGTPPFYSIFTFFLIIRVSILFMFLIFIFIIQINQFIFLFSLFNYKKCISCIPCWCSSFYCSNALKKSIFYFGESLRHWNVTCIGYRTHVWSEVSVLQSLWLLYVSN